MVLPLVVQIQAVPSPDWKGRLHVSDLFWSWRTPWTAFEPSWPHPYNPLPTVVMEMEDHQQLSQQSLQSLSCSTQKWYWQPGIKNESGVTATRSHKTNKKAIKNLFPSALLERSCRLGDVLMVGGSLQASCAFAYKCSSSSCFPGSTLRKVLPVHNARHNHYHHKRKREVNCTPYLLLETVYVLSSKKGHGWYQQPTPVARHWKYHNFLFPHDLLDMPSRFQHDCYQHQFTLI